MNRTAVSIGLCMWIGVAIRSFGQDSLFAYRTDGNSFTSNVYLNDLPTRAFRHFRKTYPTAVQERWVKTLEGFVAYFGHRDSISVRVLYNQKGYFEKAWIYYARGKTPKPLVESMNRVWPDYTVVYTSELDQGPRKTYEILLEGDTGVKVIDLSDQDMTTVFEYRYGRNSVTGK